MSDKDLGELTENFESEVENLKNTKMKLFGITMTPTTIMGVFALLGSLGGGLYGGFEVYKDYTDMKEIVVNIDVDAIASENEKVLLKMEENLARINEAIEYTRDIKTGLRDDILGIEKQVDRTEDKLRESEEQTREIIQNAEERFENKRDALQNDYDEKANSLRNSNNSRMNDLETKVERDLESLRAMIERDMRELDGLLNDKLQRALNNPLAN